MNRGVFGDLCASPPQLAYSAEVRHRSLFLGLLLGGTAVALPVACGGSTFSANEDGGAGAGGNGSGGADAGGDAAGGSGGMGVCPTDLPSGVCTSEGLVCNYNDCCPVTATCLGGAWVVDNGACMPPACPPDAPINGADCSCSEGLECMFLDCASSGMMARSVCSPEGRWQVTVDACNPVVENCFGNGFGCEPGQICTRQESERGSDTIECVTDPCWPEDLDCTCAQAACEPGQICEFVNSWEEFDQPGHLRCGLP